MAQEEKKEEEKSEGEILNWEESKTYSSEEVEAIKKEMQSNSEKGVQKILWEKKAFEKAMSSLDIISEDNTKLIDLFEEDEKAGQIILDKYYNWQSIEDFKESIQYKVDLTDPKQIDKLVEKRFAKKEALKKAEENKLATDKLNIEVQDKKEQFIKEFDLSWEELKEFEVEFEDRMTLKSFSSKSITKHLTGALRDIKPEWLSNAEINEKLAKTTWAWSSWNVPWKRATNWDKLRSEIQDFLKNNN